MCNSHGKLHDTMVEVHEAEAHLFVDVCENRRSPLVKAGLEDLGSPNILLEARKKRTKGRLQEYLWDTGGRHSMLKVAVHVAQGARSTLGS